MSEDKKKQRLNGDTPHMTADQFIRWRKNLGLKQKDVAELLGLQKRMIQYYEKGNRDGRPVVIPKSVRLACYALEGGTADYDGTNRDTLKDGTLKLPRGEK